MTSEFMPALGRCLTEPLYLKACIDRRESPPLSREVVERLRLFAGLITRVKHSFVWLAVPRTLDQIASSGRLFDVFAEYFLSNRAAISRSDRSARTADFIEFLASFLRVDQRFMEVPHLLELLDHERTQWDLSELHKKSIGVHGMSRRARRFEYRRFGRDPRKVADSASKVRAVWLLYVLDRAGSVAVRSVTATELELVKLFKRCRSLTATMDRARSDLGLEPCVVRRTLDRLNLISDRAPNRTRR